MKNYEIDYRYQKDEKREHQKDKEKMSACCSLVLMYLAMMPLSSPI